MELSRPANLVVFTHTRPWHIHKCSVICYMHTLSHIMHLSMLCPTTPLLGSWWGLYGGLTEDSAPIDLMQLMSSPHVTKREMDGGRKSAYNAAVLNGKNDRGLCSLSTAEQFASSFLTRAVWGNQISDYRPYAIPNITKHVTESGTEIRILRCHFEWRGRPWSTELKYSEALCRLTASMRHAGKPIRFNER